MRTIWNYIIIGINRRWFHTCMVRYVYSLESMKITYIWNGGNFVQLIQTVLESFKTTYVWNIKKCDIWFSKFLDVLKITYEINKININNKK